MGGEGGSAFSGGAGDGGLPAGCAEQGGGGRRGRSFSGGGGAVGPLRWVTRAVIVPVQLAACAVKPPIYAGRKGSPRPGVLEHLGNPGSLPFANQPLPYFSPGPPASTLLRRERLITPVPRSPLHRTEAPSSLGTFLENPFHFSSPSRGPRDLCASATGHDERGDKIQVAQLNLNFR